jgi:hypothetical protein
MFCGPEEAYNHSIQITLSQNNRRSVWLSSRPAPFFFSSLPTKGVSEAETRIIKYIIKPEYRHDQAFGRIVDIIK